MHPPISSQSLAYARAETAPTSPWPLLTALGLFAAWIVLELARVPLPRALTAFGFCVGFVISGVFAAIDLWRPRRRQIISVVALIVSILGVCSMLFAMLAQRLLS